MTHTLPVRLARVADLDALMTLFCEAVDWLADRGLDQWQSADRARQRTQVHSDIVAGAVWVVLDGDVIVATITVDEWADTDFWHHCDHVDDALYAHRMTVAGTHRGRALGSALLDWASEIAERESRSWLRFDAWSTNSELHGYYKRLECDMVRNVPVAWRGSGALFERRADVRSGGPRLVPAGPATQFVRSTPRVPHGRMTWWST